MEKKSGRREEEDELQRTDNQKQKDKTCIFIHRIQRINYTDAQCIYIILIKLLLITVHWQRGMNYANNDYG